MGAQLNQRSARVITASTRASQGIYKDLSGEILAEGLRTLGYEVGAIIIIPDNPTLISAEIKSALDAEIDLIITTGGTGVSPTDCTPEATAPLVEKLIPGIPEALREFSRKKVATADLSRGIAGTTGRSLIINLPGSPGAVRDGLIIIEKLAGHVLDQLAGKDHSISS